MNTTIQPTYQQLLDYTYYVEDKLDMDEYPFTFQQWLNAAEDLKEHDTQLD